MAPSRAMEIGFLSIGWPTNSAIQLRTARFVRRTGVVNETDGMKSVSVMEGDSVTLHTDAEIHTDDLIVWRFGDKGILLAKLDVWTNESSLNDADERFKDRLQLNQTGSLTITNTRTEHTGLYEVQIRGSESSQRFLLSVTAPTQVLSRGAIAGITVAVLLAVAVLIHCQCRISKLKKQVGEDKSAKEGESVTLPTGLTEIHKDDKIQWWYEDENNLIAEIHGVNMRTEKVEEGKSVTLHNDAEIQTGDLILWTFGAENSLVARKDSRTDDIDESLSDRLELNNETGSLTIRNISTTDSGHFKLQIINSKTTTFRRFNVDVTDNCEMIKSRVCGAGVCDGQRSSLIQLQSVSESPISTIID
ncbi:hypothetical protein cypCar_00045920 [Cyprinus carpio]|nr:hypothetical protein cypCar_00045920 [Cyprinus carpio]